MIASTRAASQLHALDDPTCDELRSDIRALESRLRIGWMRCENERDPAHRDRLESFWCRLLGQYVAACDDLTAMTG